jgi:hypothetical protein
MAQRIDQIVARVEDPANPVVWLDPSTSDEIWQALPEALKKRGFAVVLLDGVEGAETMRLELLGVLGGGPALREALRGLEWDERQQGWAILFRRPEPLRESDEAAFEELLETVAQVHEFHWQARRGHLKLVVTD